MLAKQGWRLLSNPNSLVAHIYKAKYFPYGDVLNSKLGSNPSYAWKSIFNGLEVIRKCTCWRVGNERLIHIWDNKWLPTPTTYKVISPPRMLDDYPVIFALIDPDTRRWKADLIRALFLPFEASIILNVPLSHNLLKDKVIWVGNKKGDFTIKSTYYIALKVLETNETGESSKGDPRFPLWRKLWHLKIPAKFRIFAWRACMNALLTKLNLSKREVNTNVSCPICDEEVETTSHSLISCEYAK